MALSLSSVWARGKGKKTAPAAEPLSADRERLEGGMMSFGMVVLALSPWIAGKTRKVRA